MYTLYDTLFTRLCLITAFNFNLASSCYLATDKRLVSTYQENLELFFEKQTKKS